MKIFSTVSKKQNASFSILIVLSVVFLLTSFTCANTPADSLNKDSEKYLSFYETVEGESVHWEANFFGDEITSIYKNGKRIPDDLLADYKEKVYDQLDDMRFGERKFSFKMPVIVGDDFDFDMKDFQKELEEMQKNLPKLDEQFQMYKFNDEDFKKQMEELKKELKENHIKPEDFNFYFKEEEDSET